MATLKDSVYRKVLRKAKTWTDSQRGHFAIQVERDIPLRIHAENGAYVFSVGYDSEGYVQIFQDESFTDHPQAGMTRRITWKQPLGEVKQESN